MAAKNRLRRWLLWVVLGVMVLGAGTWGVMRVIENAPKHRYSYPEGGALLPRPFPDARFAVLSDTHLYDESLGVGGEAFERYLEGDRKLLAESAAVIDLAIERILASNAQFVLVPGDLTKDGERIDHEQMAQKLQRLRDAGKKVYIVPGNHDVNNGVAYGYQGASVEKVANASPEDFARIYERCGYADAIQRDADSLSYVAQPLPGLWLLALDSCRYRENLPDEAPITNGAFTQKQIEWIESVLTSAAAQNQAVMVMMHHGVNEHWKGQAKLHTEYLVEDYRRIGELFARYGVQVVFTGHYHAQDVTARAFKVLGKTVELYDVETGSLVTYPCPLRAVSLSGYTLTIRSEKLVDTAGLGEDFRKKAYDTARQGVQSNALNTLSKYKVRGEDADILSNAVADAFMAHYTGDEVADKQPKISGLGLWGRFILLTQQSVLDGLYNDLPPEDGDLQVDMSPR